MLQYATPVQRVFELIIDYIVFYVVFFIYLFTFGEQEEGEHILRGISMLPIIAYWFIYFPLIEGITGQTLGKLVMKIRVAPITGGELKIWQTFVRRLFDCVDLMFFGLVGILVMSKSEKNQRVGDQVAGTIVIRHHEVACVNCGVTSVLTPNELVAGKFECPDCGHLND